MVFLIHAIKRVVIVEPRHLGKDMKAHLRKQCQSEVVGKTVGDSGLVIATFGIRDEDIGKGRIDDITGNCHFDVSFDAICFRLVKNEVLDAVVETCWATGLLLTTGPGLRVVVDMGHLPSDMDFVASGDGDYWASEGENGVAIKKGSAVRVRIINPTKEGRDLAGLASLTEPFLGLVE